MKLVKVCALLIAVSGLFFQVILVGRPPIDPVIRPEMQGSSFKSRFKSFFNIGKLSMPSSMSKSKVEIKPEPNHELSRVQKFQEQTSSVQKSPVQKIEDTISKGFDEIRAKAEFKNLTSGEKENVIRTYVIAQSDTLMPVKVPEIITNREHKLFLQEALNDFPGLKQVTLSRSEEKALAELVKTPERKELLLKKLNETKAALQKKHQEAWDALNQAYSVWIDASKSGANSKAIAAVFDTEINGNKVAGGRFLEFAQQLKDRAEPLGKLNHMIKQVKASMPQGLKETPAASPVVEEGEVRRYSMDEVSSGEVPRSRSRSSRSSRSSKQKEAQDVFKEALPASQLRRERSTRSSQAVSQKPISEQLPPPLPPRVNPPARIDQKSTSEQLPPPLPVRSSSLNQGSQAVKQNAGVAINKYIDDVLSQQETSSSTKRNEKLNDFSDIDAALRELQADRPVENTQKQSAPAQRSNNFLADITQGTVTLRHVEQPAVSQKKSGDTNGDIASALKQNSLIDRVRSSSGKPATGPDASDAEWSN